MEITSSGVSVYEVVLDLKHWEGRLSNQVPGFVDALVQVLPSTIHHKCLSGKEGGFHDQMNEGTNLGHVVEHVLLELIKMAHPDGPEYSGWTKSQGGGRYVIHYGAPDFLTGRLAAILAVELVEDLLRGRRPDLEFLVNQLRRPMEYFSQDGAEALDLTDPQDPETRVLTQDAVPPLDSRQIDKIAHLLADLEPRLDEVYRHWRQAFFTFGGQFARGIEDKTATILPGNNLGCLTSGRMEPYLQGVSNLCGMMRAQQIPRNFVTHAVWQYKNFLQVVLMNHLSSREAEDISLTIEDFDDFFMNIFHHIMEGYSRPTAPVEEKDDLTLCGFRARQARRSTVLVIDDDIMTRKVVVNILAYHGLPTLEARDGMEGLNLLVDEGHKVGLVILDVVMPGLDGKAVCRRIRDSQPHAKVLLSSGFPLDDDFQVCLDQHAVDFLRKPFTAPVLMSKVEDLMDLEVTGNGVVARA